MPFTQTTAESSSQIRLALAATAQMAGALDLLIAGHAMEHQLQLNRITHAISEGFNSKIQALKAAARGFRNVANYRIRILFFCGKVDFSY